MEDKMFPFWVVAEVQGVMVVAGAVVDRLFPLTDAAVDAREEKVNCPCSCQRSAASLSFSLFRFYW